MPKRTPEAKTDKRYRTTVGMNYVTGRDAEGEPVEKRLEAGEDIPADFPPDSLGWLIEGGYIEEGSDNGEV